MLICSTYHYFGDGIRSCAPVVEKTSNVHAYTVNFGDIELSEAAKLCRPFQHTYQSKGLTESGIIDDVIVELGVTDVEDSTYHHTQLLLVSKYRRRADRDVYHVTNGDLFPQAYHPGIRALSA